MKEQLEARDGNLRLTDDQRRRLAAKGEALGRKLLRGVPMVVTPDDSLFSALFQALVASSGTEIDHTPSRRQT